MRMAGSIILGVIGAILYFAVTVDVAGISLPTVGIILMAAAGVWFLIEVVQAATGERTTKQETVRRSDGTVEERETKVRDHSEL